MPIVFPTPEPPRRPTSGWWGGLRFGLLLLLPAAAIFGFIDWMLTQAGETYVQPDAVFYRRGNSPVLAAVLDRFEAYTTGLRGTSGTDHLYAAAYDLPTGQQLWRTPLQAPSGWSGAALLGQNERYLFYACAGLYTLDKQTGRVVAGPDGYGPVSANLSRATVIDNTLAQNYRYDDSARAVLARGTDGLYYAIDGQSLQARPYAPPDKFAQQTTAKRLYDGHDGFNQRPVPDYDASITDVYDDGRTCLALLDDPDTVQLAHNAYGVAERGRTESVRRRFYAEPATNSGGWQPLTPGRVYLFGGLLVDERRPYRQPADSISRVQAYQSLRQRYGVPYAPLVLPAGSWLLAHRATIEPNASVLLTAVAPSGQVRWQTNLGQSMLGPRYVDAATGRLYLLGPASSKSSNLQQVRQLDLRTGQLSGYAIRERNSWWSW